MIYKQIVSDHVDKTAYKGVSEIIDLNCDYFSDHVSDHVDKPINQGFSRKTDTKTDTNTDIISVHVSDHVQKHKNKDRITQSCQRNLSKPVWSNKTILLFKKATIRYYRIVRSIANKRLNSLNVYCSHKNNNLEYTFRAQLRNT